MKTRDTSSNVSVGLEDDVVPTNVGQAVLESKRFLNASVYFLIAKNVFG
jgi:hypothetical protein